MNRRLIRPNLAEIKEKIKNAESAPKTPASPQPQPLPPIPPRPSHQGAPMSSGRPSSMPPSRGQGPKKMHPPTDTSAESYYYLKQMSKKTPMAVVFADGEVIEGYIEWYDRNCIKLNRDNAPNLLVYKSKIKYIYKLDEGKDAADGESDDRK
jgi:sRNA-binding regulator protein Hfq